MAIRSKLTTRDDRSPAPATTQQQSSGGGGGGRREISEEEKAKRKERVAAAKDALKRSVDLKGDHVVSARATLKSYLQRLNEPRQPDDDTFAAMIEAPFKAPPKKREQRR